MPSIKKIFSVKALSKALKPSKPARTLVISEPTLVECERVFPDGTVSIVPFLPSTFDLLFLSRCSPNSLLSPFFVLQPYPYEWTRKHYLEEDAREKAFASAQRLIADSKARSKAFAANLVVWNGNDGWRFQQRPVRHLREAASWEEGEEEEEEDLAAYGAWVVPSDEEKEGEEVAVVVAAQKQGERVWWA